MLFREKVFDVQVVVNHVKTVSRGWFISLASYNSVHVLSDWWVNPLPCLFSL